MEIRKDKNLVKIYDGEKLCGGWDILTNTYIGQKGQQLKAVSVPFTRELRNMVLLDDADELANVVYQTISGICPWHLNNAPYSAIAPRIEALISVKLYPNDSYDTWSYLRTNNQPALKKELVSFLKEKCNSVYSPENISKYTFYTGIKNANQYTNTELDWAFKVFHEVTEYYNNNISTDWVIGMINNGIHEKAYMSACASSFATILTGWYNMVNTMNDTLEIKRNILTNYAILSWVYKEYKEKNYDAGLKKNNDLSWLHFENDDFIAFPLTTKKQFHIEAEYQHNCVERMYMDSVFEGKTHVVAIRRKNDLDTPYITCEVSNFHEILQYLTRFNNRPTDSNSQLFYREYKNHLLSSLSE